MMRPPRAGRVGPPLRTWRDGRALWEEWAFATLLEQRRVFLTGTLDQELAAQVSGELMLLDASGDDPIEIHIDSGDGDIDAAITLVDVIDLLGVPVHMVCVGRAVGPSLAVFAVGAPRLALPHARFRLCEPSASFDGPATAVGAWAEHRHAVLDRLCVRLGHATGRTSEEVRELMHRGEFWDAEAAREHGFVDEVAGPEARVLRFPRRIGFHPEP